MSSKADMERSLETSLAKLIHASVRVSAGNGYAEPGAASLRLDFADGTWMQADYWRVMKDGSRKLSSFDHQQKYGLPAPIDAIDQLRGLIADADLTSATVDRGSGDLFFGFENGAKLQILNVTGYEVFEIRFPDGTGEYSNYI
jgi:hypothetical protein